MSKERIIYSLIVAAGKGSRMNSDLPKQLMPYGGSTVLEAVVRKFYTHPKIDAVVVVSPEDGSLDDRYDELLTPLTVGNEKCILGTTGGEERYESVCNGLDLILGDALYNGYDPENVLVLIHDAARPGITAEIIDNNIAAMDKCRAVVTAVPSIDILECSTGIDKTLTTKKLKVVGFVSSSYYVSIVQKGQLAITWSFSRRRIW